MRTLAVDAMRTVAVAVVLAIAAVAAASPADELLERGLRSYAVGRYDEAIASFQRGYELAPRPDLLYALGQAQRMKGDCRAAVASYRAYLRTAPPERSAAPARQNLERCEKELASSPSAPNTSPSAPNTSPSAPSTSPSAPSTSAAAPNPSADARSAVPRRRARDDRAAAILASAGGAALVAGGVLWGVGEAGARSLADAATYDQFAAHARDGDTYARERIAGMVGVAVGGALVTIAIALVLARPPPLTSPPSRLGALRRSGSFRLVPACSGSSARSSALRPLRTRQVRIAERRAVDPIAARAARIHRSHRDAPTPSRTTATPPPSPQQTSCPPPRRAHGRVPPAASAVTRSIATAVGAATVALAG